MKRNEEAVSPVIGVILMVAITVILAAVIAAFVFGMAGSIPKTKNVAAATVKMGNDVYVTYHGGSDASQVSALGATAQNLTQSTASTGDFGASTSVGAVQKFSGGIGYTRTHVVATAAFSDGSSQVILDTYL